MYTWIEFTADKAFHQYMWEAPIDENRTRIYFINLRNMILDPAMDERVKERNLVIAHQDIDVLGELDPIRTPASNTKEILMPSDKAVLRYREWLKQWEDKGWRIDLKTLREERGDVAFAIPSPARRSSGNWVLDPVPLMPAREAKASAAKRTGTG
jgi:hypothetical protein